MIKIITDKNIFDTECQTIVNTVNCVGVMGKGIALEMRKRFPLMFIKYRNYCINDMIHIGTLYLNKDYHKWVLNFPTKTHWRCKSKIEWIKSGLEKFVSTYKEKNITSIAFPMLGCSNGGLNKDEVLPIMLEYFQKCDDDILIEIYV